MRISEKLRMLSALIALGGALLSSGLGHAASDTFEGTWYGNSGVLSLRIELHRDGDRLAGSAVVLLLGRQSFPYRVTKAEQVGDVLRLNLSSQGPSPLTEEIEIELRVPRNELVGEMFLGQGTEGVPLVMSQDAPDLAALFAEAKLISAEQLSRQNSARLRASCANNLKQLSLVMKMFANESRGTRFPRPDRLKILSEDIYPVFLFDPKVLMCPADDTAPEDGMPDADKAQWYFDHSRYWYIGHAINDEEQALAYVEAYRKIVQAGDGNLDVDFVDATSGYERKIFRTREGIERFLITDINKPRGAAIMRSTMPVLIERPGTHLPEGGNVLFLDGHVAFFKYPGKFPMTEAFIEGLRSLDALDSGR